MKSEQPKFNPHDEKYKKVNDLPEDERENYVDTEGKGFITQRAANFDEDMEKAASDYNKNRSRKQKILGTGILAKTDIAQINADAENKYRDNEVKTRERSIKFEAEWPRISQEFIKAQELYILPGYSAQNMNFKLNMNSSININLYDLIDKGLISRGQLDDIFELEVVPFGKKSIEGSAFASRRKLISGWKEKLEKILGKKLIILEN